MASFIIVSGVYLLIFSFVLFMWIKTTQINEEEDE